MMCRICYLDCLRGIVMLMVVFCHVCEFSLDSQENLWICHIFGIIMLSGFFFVSGYFSRICQNGGAIVKRLRYMLLPTISMFFLYVFAYWGNLDRLAFCLHNEYKWGYWFTFALFLMNVLHWTVSALVKTIPFKEQKKEQWILVFMLAVIVFIVLLKGWDNRNNGGSLINWFSLRLIAMYFPFYLMGVMCKHFNHLFHRIVTNDYIIGMAMVFFTGSLFHRGGFYYGLLQGGFGIILLYRFCFQYRNILSSNTIVGKQLSLIGRNTLPIYLIHYFLLLGMKLFVVGIYLDAKSQWLMIFVIALSLTIMVAYFSIAIKRIMDISKPLSSLLIGK